MKITMYELLGMVKDGKAPKRIKQGCEYYEFIEENNDYLQKSSENYYLFSDKYNIALTCRLDDTVEILEEKKIPEKLEKYIHTDSLNYNQCNYMFEKLTNKYNELLDYLKSKGE